DLDPRDLETEVRRVIAAAHQEPGGVRRHARCDAWHAHIDEMQVAVELSRDHTCTISGKTNCAPCMEFEVELWDAINRYTATCGGDLDCVNGPRMQAVVAVNEVVAKAILRRQIHDLAVETLVEGHKAVIAAGAAAVTADAAAGARGEEIVALQTKLR